MTRKEYFTAYHISLRMVPLLVAGKDVSKNDSHRLISILSPAAKTLEMLLLHSIREFSSIFSQLFHLYLSGVLRLSDGIEIIR